MQVRFLTPFFTKAAIRFSGIPHNPKPPTISVMPSLISAMAVSASFTVLLIMVQKYYFISPASTLWNGAFLGNLHKMQPLTKSVPLQQIQAPGGVKVWVLRLDTLGFYEGGNKYFKLKYNL